MSHVRLRSFQRLPMKRIYQMRHNLSQRLTQGVLRIDLMSIVYLLKRRCLQEKGEVTSICPIIGFWDSRWPFGLHAFSRIPERVLEQEKSGALKGGCSLKLSVACGLKKGTGRAI
jgi:hypothetical protein